MLLIFFRILKLLLALILLLVGIAGIILPIVNGTFFLILAFILISFESKYVKHKLHALTKKNKTIHALHLYLEKIMIKLFRIKD